MRITDVIEIHLFTRLKVERQVRSVNAYWYRTHRDFGDDTYGVGWQELTWTNCPEHKKVVHIGSCRNVSVGSTGDRGPLWDQLIQRYLATWDQRCFGTPEKFRSIRHGGEQIRREKGCTHQGHGCDRAGLNSGFGPSHKEQLKGLTDTAAQCVHNHPKG